MRKLFDPQSIAIIGATGDRRRIGGIALDHLVAFEYAGSIYPINPKYEALFGLPCYPDIESVPNTPDLVVLSVAAASVLPALERCHARGVAAAIVYASGFAEESAAGAALQDELVRFARRTGMVVSGPNCMGHANLRTRAITAFATLFKDYPPPAEALAAKDDTGYAAVVTQSGNLCGMLYALGCERGVRFKHFVNTGNEACLEFSEYLSYLADEPDTRTIIGYIEGLRDGARFIDAARRLRANGKALIVIKVGDTEKGAQAALSHTAALSGNQAVYDAAFRQLGVMRATDPSHLVDIAYLARFSARSAGRRVAVASISGAMGALLTDLLVARGLDVPTLPDALQAELKSRAPTIGMLANPIDLTAQIFDQAGVATAVIGSLAQTEAVDAVVIYATGFLLDRIADEAIAVARSSGRLIVAIDSGRATCREALQHAGIPVFTDVARCVAALGTYLHWRAFQSTDAAPVIPPSQDVSGSVSVPGIERDADEHQTKRWLAGHGVPVVAEAVVADVESAVRFAQGSSMPLAVKILSPDIAHKTEAGGVRLGVQGEAGMREAFAAVHDGARRSHPDAKINGVLLQPMESGICELIVGVTRDPVFGLAMTVGLGGIFTELFRDVTHRLLPVDESTAREMLRELKAYPLMTGFRGKPAADIDAACRAIAAVSRAALALGPACGELEINPLLVRQVGMGAVALDALLLTAQTAPAAEPEPV
ncbi:acetate--CoA ligase family protein [Variovorax sp. J31P207]|uniref:acetate--CoA ligase family protein n=1 Tax=Variovorax sp. J31P207 TaxID=3053510 RepID=UPI0025790BD6|nr:acetate--CoA ligase family protein [Variovorax sp. J31P207]MDM0071423.1 acetate--CoA ligase family protein [Variovorax sp. J31P207]